MELDALALTCRHLRNERDGEMAKLAKQKHAAHVMCYRLRQKLRRLELSSRLILALFLATESHNRTLRNQTVTSLQEQLADLHDVGV